MARPGDPKFLRLRRPEPVEPLHRPGTLGGSPGAGGSVWLPDDRPVPVAGLELGFRCPQPARPGCGAAGITRRAGEDTAAGKTAVCQLCRSLLCVVGER